MVSPIVSEASAE